MSKQGETAVKELERLLSQRVSVGNVSRWIEDLEWVNQMYCPERNELQSVLALFVGSFDKTDKAKVSAAMKIAKAELRPIVRRIKKANGIK